MIRNRYKYDVERFEPERREHTIRTEENSLTLDVERTRDFLIAFQDYDYQAFNKLHQEKLKQKHHYYFNEQYLKSKKYVESIIIYLVCSYDAPEINQLFRRYLSYINFELISNTDYSQLPNLIARFSEEDYLGHKKLQKALSVNDIDIKKSMTAFFQEGSAVNHMDQKAKQNLEKKWADIQVPLLMAIFFEFEQHIFFFRRQDFRKRLGFKYIVQPNGSEELRIHQMENPPHLLEAFRSLTKGDKRKERSLNYRIVSQGLQIYANNALNGVLSRNSINNIQDRLKEIMQVDEISGISSKDFSIEEILPWLAVQISAEAHNSELDPFYGLGDVVHYHGAAFIHEDFLENELANTPLEDFSKAGFKKYLTTALGSAMPYLKNNMIKKILPNVMKEVNDNMREDKVVIVKRIMRDLCIKEAIMQAPKLLNFQEFETSSIIREVPKTNKFNEMTIEKQSKIKKVLIAGLGQNLKKADQKVERKIANQKNTYLHEVPLDRKLKLEKNARDIDNKVEQLRRERENKKNEKKESYSFSNRLPEKQLRNKLIDVFDVNQKIESSDDDEERQEKKKMEAKNLKLRRRNENFDLKLEDKIPKFTPTAMLENHRTASPVKEKFKKEKEYSRDCVCLIF